MFCQEGGGVKGDCDKMVGTCCTVNSLTIVVGFTQRKTFRIPLQSVTFFTL